LDNPTLVDELAALRRRLEGMGWLHYLEPFIPAGATADKQTVTAAVETVLQQGNTCNKAYRSLLQVLPHPAEEQLQPSEYFELALLSLRTNGELLVVPYSWHYWKPFEGLGWAEVQQLLQLAVAKSAASAIGQLADVPAAVHIDLPLLLELLQVIVATNFDSCKDLERLLKLPAAQQLSHGHLQQLLSAAVSAGHAQQVLSLLEQLPAADRAASDLSSELLKQLLLAVCSNHQWICRKLDLVLPLLEHPGAASLTAGDVADVAVAYMDSVSLTVFFNGWATASASEVAKVLVPLQQLQQLAVMQQLQCPETLLQILTACMTKFGSHLLQQ
jgi:hypothetical protein